MFVKFKRSVAHKIKCVTGKYEFPIVLNITDPLKEHDTTLFSR